MRTRGPTESCLDGLDGASAIIMSGENGQNRIGCRERERWAGTGLSMELETIAKRGAVQQPVVDHFLSLHFSLCADVECEL